MLIDRNNNIKEIKMNELKRCANQQAITASDINGAIIGMFVNSLDVRETSRKTYTKGLNYFVTYLNREGIDTPTRSDILAYKDYLTRTYTASTASTYLTAVRKFYSYLNAETGVANVAAGIKNPKTSRTGHLKDALTVEQARDMMQAVDADTVKGKRDLAIIELMTLTGLRTIEVIRADVEDVRSIDGAPVLYVQGKGRDAKDEYVKLPQTVINALQSYLDARDELKPVRDNQPLFTSASNRNALGRLTTRSISRICKETMKDAGINSKRLTAHSLRHTAVTFALKAGANIRDVQQMARHSNVATTERYAHDLRRLNNSAEDMAEALLLAC